MSDTTGTATVTTQREPIDSRGPRFGAGITAVLLLVVAALDLGAPESGGARIAGWSLLAAIAALFAWGAFAGISRHPYGRVFAVAIRPRLRGEARPEDPAAPTFAQGVGFAVTSLGLLAALLGVPFAVAAAASIAFVAAFLNAAFDYCVGCRVYVLLLRARRVDPADSTLA